MRRRARWLMVAGLLVLPLLLTACGGDSAAESEAAGPVTVYEADGTGTSRIELTAEAAKRLDVQTAAVAKNGSGTVIPYSAVFYSPTGETWAYVSPKELSFQRQRIVVDHIDGDVAVLSEGPKPGTKVATVGVAELFGAESGLGE